MTIKKLILCGFICVLFMYVPTVYAKRSFIAVVSDEVITLNLKTKFIKDKQVPANDIFISVRSGVVTLKGELSEQAQINRAVEISERQKGVKEVKAFLVLKEFGQLREDSKHGGKQSFFKNIFKPDKSNNKLTNNNKSKLREQNLVVEKSTASQAPDTVATEPITVPKLTESGETLKTGDLDKEEDF